MVVGPQAGGLSYSRARLERTRGRGGQQLTESSHERPTVLGRATCARAAGSEKSRRPGRWKRRNFWGWGAERGAPTPDVPGPVSGACGLI